MRTRSRLLAFLLALAGLVAAPHAGRAAGRSRSLSPYFFVEGDPDVDQLPLSDTRVDFDISGVIADVTVSQTYKNAGKRPINARYVFPASTNAAVHGMKMTIGNRVIVAKIRERKQAEHEFLQAQKEGKSATLLEEDRPNVFTMNVANVMPGDRIDVELRYTELLVPEKGVYEFVYPTVVGPRYVGADASGEAHDRFVRSPYLHAGEVGAPAFEMKGTISAGVPVRALHSESHELRTSAALEGATQLELAKSDTHGANRDFVLDYELAGDKMLTGLSLYEDKDESFFMLMVQPPARPVVEDVPARDYVFIVDTSGSMHGFPLEITKVVLRNLIGSLRPTDTFNVLLFSGDSRLLSPRSLAATPGNVETALTLLDREDGAGGTEMLAAIERAMSLPMEKHTARSFVVVTDGYIAEEEGVFSYIRAHLDRANVFAFGIGSSVNRHLIEGVAKAGLGESFVVLGPADADAEARRFADYLRTPVLTDAKVRFDGFDAYDVEPKVLPTVFAERPVIIRGKYRGAPHGSITLSGTTGTRAFSATTDVAQVKASSLNEPLRYLWARECIADLTSLGLDKAAVHDRVVTLGLAYNLLTEFTSFVAIDERIRAEGQPATNVAQPLPMPAGVEDAAVGEGDEPSLWILCALVGPCALVVAQRRRTAS